MNNIGYKLASLQTEHEITSYLKSDLSEENISNIKLLREQLKQNNIPGKLSFPLPAIPEYACSGQDIFLKDNHDFFISYILGSPEEKNCLQLFTHLNDCYNCFSIFSQTMRDYFNKKQEIVKNANGVAI